MGERGVARAEATRAFALDPRNQEAAMQHAIDEQEQGRTQQAIEVLRKSTAPGNRVLLAKYLRQLGDQESKTEAVATLRGVEKEVAAEEPWLRRMWANELVAMLAEDGKADDGFAALESLSPTFVGDVTRRLLQGVLYEAKGDRSSALSSVKDALKALAGDNPWDEQRRLALQLQGFALFEMASDVWKRIVVPNSLREDVFSYLHCAHRAGKDEDVLKFCKTARAEGVWLPELVSTEIALLEKYNSKSAALQVARDFLKSTSDDAAVRVHVALVAVRAGEYALARELQARLPSAKEVQPNVGRAVVEILRCLGQLAEAATYAYDLVRVNPDDLDAHKAVLVSFGLGGVPPQIPSHGHVEAGTAIRYREDDTGREEWCVIESDLAVEGGPEVVGSAHPLVAELLGKTVGESFVLRRSPIQERRGTLLEIVDKRVWRFRDSMEKWERRFPDDVSLQKFVIPDEGEVETRLAPMFRAADLRAQSQEEGLQLYRSGRVPLYLLSKVTGGTLFEATLGAAGLPDTPVYTCIGNEPERAASTAAFLSARGLVLDATALATLFFTGTDEVLKASKVPLLVSEGTLDELRSSEILAHADGEPLSRLGRIDGKYRLTRMSPEQVAQQKKRLQAFVERVSASCEVVPGLSLAYVDADKREQLILLVGRPLAESAAVASQRGCALWTDDYLAAVVAGELIRCKRVWSQLVFEEETRAGEFPQEVYAKLVKGLFEAGYSYVWLTPELIALIGGACAWDLADPGFERVLGHFADPNVNTSSLGVLTLKTLRLLWGGEILGGLAQAVTVRLGANILRRPGGRPLLEAIKTNVQKAFGVDVLGRAGVSAILSALESVPVP